MPIMYPKTMTPRLNRRHTMAARVRWHSVFHEHGPVARDLSPWGHHSTFFSSIRADSPWGQCVRLDGSIGYLPIADRPHLRLTTWTVAAWVNTASFTLGQTVLMKGSPTTRNYGLFIDATNGRPYTQYTVGGTFKTAIHASQAVTLNRWHHLCGTYDGANIKMYLDGILQATLATTSACDQDANILAVGRTGSSSTEYMNGYLDGPLVATGAATDDEVAKLAMDHFSLSRSRSSPAWMFAKANRPAWLANANTLIGGY